LLAYVLLASAIVAEVFGSSMMKLSDGFKRKLPSLLLVVGYAVSFYLFSLALKDLPLGSAYAIWAGLGTALTAVAGILAFREKLNARKLLGMLVIIAGVVLVEIARESH
jgi:Membrane transporters of cations and cationic drugs